MKLSTFATLPTAMVAFLTQEINAESIPRDCSGTTEWDTIVVGAGLSGSIVAAKLADLTDKCILIIEAGKDSGQILDAEEADVADTTQLFFENGWQTVHQSPETAWNTPGTYDLLTCWGKDCDYFWKGDESAQNLYAAKLVGGGGAINGALMQYPPDSNWDIFPEGWKASDMDPYLLDVEDKLNPTNYPSSDGIHYNDHLGPNIVKQAMENEGWTYNETDAAYYKPQGKTMGIPKVTADSSGRRTSSTSEYLAPVLGQSNIELWTETEAKKIVLDANNKKATGLEVSKTVDGETTTETISLADNGLIVLSGGAVKTPELLFDSEIGPVEGWKVYNEYVGKGLTDKTIAWVNYGVSDITEVYNLNSPPAKDQSDYATYGKGPLAQFGPLLVGLIEIEDETKEEEEEENLVEFFVSVAKEQGIITVYFVHLTPHAADAQINPDDDLTVTGAQWDWDYSGYSTNKAIDTMDKAMKKLGYDQTSGGDPSLHQMNHPGSTCKMGTCVNKDSLIVEGVDNIAVCDNSIVPAQIKVHTAHSLMAIALRGADIFKDFLTQTTTTKKDDEL